MGIGKKVEIFKGEQQAKIGEQTEQKIFAPRAALRMRRHAQAGKIIDERRNNDQRDIFPIPAHVEKIAADEQQRPPVAMWN